MSRRHALAAGLALAAAPAIAQEPGSRPTREYVQAAGQSDTFEMLEAHTALARSTDRQVRAYAEMMLRDHAGIARALRDATARSGLRPPPMALGDEQARLLSALQSLSGRDLDETYVEHQALGHRSALTAGQLYVAAGDDAAVRQAAVAAAPVIAAHLAAAERMRAAFGGR